MSKTPGTRLFVIGLDKSFTSEVFCLFFTDKVMRERCRAKKMKKKIVTITELLVSWLCPTFFIISHTSNITFFLIVADAGFPILEFTD